MSQLLNDFYIQIKSGNHKTGLVYEITSFEEYKHLKNQVNTVLDKVLKNIAPKIKKQVVREPLK
jgi:hypothetical protein